MSRLISLLFLLFIFCNMAAEETSPSQERKVVLVSILPHRYFVNKIAPDIFDVEVLVPPGVSSHTFEPSPQQIMKASKAEVWFAMGDAFEDKLKEALLFSNPHLKIADTRDKIELIQESGCISCCHVHGADPHVWLSPKAAKIQAKTIADGLSAILPERKEEIEKGLESFINELEKLDLEIEGLLKDITPFSVVVSHPAFAYFDRDYNVHQISVETEGREPTPKQLTYLLREIEKLPLKSIFLIPQHANKGSTLIAKHLGINLVNLDPYAEDYIHNLLHIAKSFKASKKNPEKS